MVLAGKVSLLSLVPKEKAKVEPMVKTNLKSLPCFAVHGEYLVWQSGYKMRPGHKLKRHQVTLKPS